MQSKRKANSVITHAVAGSVITFTVGEQSFTMDVDKIPNEVRYNATMHGFVQKVSDRAAIGRDPETGASATPEEKFAAMKECADRLMAGGPWNAVATGTGSAGGLLYRAMRNLYPNTWSDKTAFQGFILEKAVSESARLGRKVTESDIRAEYLEMKHIAKEVKRIKDSERTESGIDTKALLAGLPE